jgi:hypothetical protein
MVALAHFTAPLVGDLSLHKDLGPYRLPCARRPTYGGFGHTATIYSMDQSFVAPGPASFLLNASSIPPQAECTRFKRKTLVILCPEHKLVLTVLFFREYVWTCFLLRGSSCCTKYVLQSIHPYHIVNTLCSSLLYSSSPHKYIVWTLMNQLINRLTGGWGHE